MEAMKTKPALTKTQREILELLKVEGEYIKCVHSTNRMYEAKYKLNKSGRVVSYNMFRGLKSFLKLVANPDAVHVWRYCPFAKQTRTERLADRNRRWKAAILSCSPDYDVNLEDRKLAAVFDAIASEASCGEVAEVLRR